MKLFGLIFALAFLVAGCGNDGGNIDPSARPNDYQNWPPMHGPNTLNQGPSGNCLMARSRHVLIRVIRDGSMPLGHGYYQYYVCSRKKVWKIFRREECIPKPRSSSGPQGMIEHELGVAREQLVEALVRIISNAKGYQAFSGHYHRIALEGEFWDFDLCQPLVAQPLYIQKTQ